MKMTLLSALLLAAAPWAAAQSYDSAFASYQAYAEPRVADWKATNAAVAAPAAGADPHAGHTMHGAPAGAHAGHAMPQAKVPATDPHAAHKAQAAGKKDPHAGHAMPPKKATPVDPHAGHKMEAPVQPPAPETDPHAGHNHL